MKRISFFDIAVLVLSVLLCLGTQFFFHACGAMEDGSWMSCHNAQKVVVALGAAFVVLSVARLFLAQGAKTGISLCIAVFSVVTLLVPKVLVPLCMMGDMRCHSVMRPAVIVICVLLFIVSAVDCLRILVKFKKSE